jgi:hypothetical protein
MTIIRGTDNSIKITFTENSSPVDITGYEVLFTLKKQCDIDKDDTYALISKDITDHTDPTAGETTLVLTNEDTDIEAGNYYYDLRLVKDGTITQTQRDLLEITNGITKRIS